MSQSLNLNIEGINKGFRNISARDRLYEVLQTPNLVPFATTSLGRDSAIMLHLINDVCPSLPVIYIDTDCQPQDKLDDTMFFQRDCIDRFNTNLITLRPSKKVDYRQALAIMQGDNEEAKQRLRKVCKLEPLERAIRTLKANFWISGISGYQTKNRENLDLLVADNETYKFHPLIDWTKDQRERYMREHNLPTNEGHYDIFKGPEQKLECGLHERAQGI